MEWLINRVNVKLWVSHLFCWIFYFLFQDGNAFLADFVHFPVLINYGHLDRFDNFGPFRFFSIILTNIFFNISDSFTRCWFWTYLETTAIWSFSDTLIIWAIFAHFGPFDTPGQFGFLGYSGYMYLFVFCLKMDKSFRHFLFWDTSKKTL